MRACKRQKGKKALREISFSIWYLVKSGTRDCSIPNGPKEEKKEEEKVVENLGAVFFNTVQYKCEIGGPTVPIEITSS